MHTALSKAHHRLGLLALVMGAAAVVAPRLATAHPAVPKNPACGSTITTSVTLSGDMSCPGSSGIVIGASNITVNLNGHTLSGDSTAGTVGVFDETGSFNNVTVKGGTITGFENGIVFDHTSGAKIENVSQSMSTEDGIEIEHSTNGLISHSSANTNGERGIYFDGNHKVKVVKSQANHNTLDGLYDENSRDTLSGVTANSNGGNGIVVDTPSAIYTIKKSTASHNALDGFLIDHNAPTAVHQAKLVGNTAESNGTAMTTGDGWGFTAEKKTKGSGNGAESNPSGNCRNVSCHTNP